MQDLCKIHEKTNPNKSHKKRLSVSDKNRPSTFNNSWTLCFGLHKWATVHFIKPSIIWKCLFCHFQNQNSTSRSAMFSWRRIFLLFPSDSSVTNYNILNVCQEHRKVANTMCEIRSMRLVCSPAVHGSKTNGKHQVLLSFSPTVCLWYSDICHQDEPLYSCQIHSSKPCCTKVLGSRNCISQLLRVSSRLWISCLGFTVK